MTYVPVESPWIFEADYYYDDDETAENMNQLAAYTVWTDAVRRGLATADEMARWLKWKALQSALRELEAMDLIKFFNEVKR